MENKSGNNDVIQWHPKTVAVNTLKAFEKNPRKISEKEMESLKKSIAEDGYHQRILCTSDLRIIGGHQRIKALLELGYRDVEVLVADRDVEVLVADRDVEVLVADRDVEVLVADRDVEVLVADRDVPDEQFSRILVRDNMEYGTWNYDGLGDLMPAAELMEIGLGDAIVRKIERGIVAGNTDPDDVPEPDEERRSAYGDIWQLGDHRVMCGDCTKTADVEKLMNGNEANLVLTDPPYNTGMCAKKNGGSTRLSHMFNDSFTPDEWMLLLSGFCNALDGVVRKDSFLFIFLDWRRSYELIPHLKKKWSFTNLIVWDKMVHGLGSDYKYSHEFIHVCKKGKPPLAYNKDGDAEYQDVWHIQRKVGRDDEHATKKPIELLERIIKHASTHGQAVLDTFLGSGSTLMACERLGRICYGMELSPAYVDVILKRWEQYTGKEAVRL